MARAKFKEKYTYILVFTDDGPKYVTNISGKTATWGYNDPPLNLGDIERAQEIALGLTFNGNNAVAVSSLYEITDGPYNYYDYHIKFERNDKENDYE